MQDTTAQRFWGKVNKDGPLPVKRPELGNCWVWKLPGGLNGYGSFFFRGRSITAHRASFIMANGDIPKGLVVDHLCELRNCVRPSHLEAVTSGENTRRARAWEQGAARQREKTHCQAGHPYSGDNLRICKDGKRACRTCERRYTAEHRERKRLANPSEPRPRQAACKYGHPYAEQGFTDEAGRQRCRICARRRTKESRDRRKAVLPPKPERETCVKGHPWVETNLYVRPATGQKSCRQCHNERTLADYHARRQMTPKSQKPPRTHCKHGHPWIAENLFLTSKGYESCRLCARERQRQYDRRLAEAARTAKSA